jgi:O-antigen/teichoic acid export membrane protein
VVAASAWSSKIIVSLIQIISIRVLLVYLGEDRYAVYVIAYSLLSWFSLSEFSIGVSLQIFISESRAKNESYEKYIIAALQIMVILFIMFVLLTFFIANPIQNIIFQKFTYIPEIKNISIAFIVGVITVITSFLGIVYRIYYALHKGYFPNMTPAVAAITSMLLIVLLNRYYPAKQLRILSALLVFTLPQLIIALIPFIKIFKNYFSKICSFNFTIIKSFFIRAVKFHGITILAVAYGQTDYLVMSQTLSPTEIVTYNIFIRVFMFFSFIYTSLLMAFWPKSAEMYIKKEFENIKHMLKKYLAYATLFIIAGTLGVMIFSGFIVKVLAPNLDIVASVPLLLLFCIYMIAKAWQDTFAAFLQSINVLRIFWIYLPFQVIINFFMQYFLSKKYGAEGIVMALILSIMLISLWILPIKTYKVLNSKI